MNAIILIFGLLCLLFGLGIIFAVLKRSRLVYSKSEDEWYILKISPLFYLLRKFYEDLDDKYIIGFHIYIASGFIILSLIVLISLLKTN